MGFHLPARTSAALATLAVLTASALAATVGVSVVPPSAAAPDPGCTAATDLTTLVPGAPLHGLTVSRARPRRPSPAR
jgi:hypothetical protein